VGAELERRAEREPAVVVLQDANVELASLSAPERFDRAQSEVGFGEASFDWPPIE
jgi:hypothetical protein